jgi:alpha-N-arabinofuranosidase
MKVNSVKGQILTNDMGAFNTFDNPDKVHTEEFTDFKITDKGINFKIPPCSVLTLTVE